MTRDLPKVFCVIYDWAKNNQGLITDEKIDPWLLHSEVDDCAKALLRDGLYKRKDLEIINHRIECRFAGFDFYKGNESLFQKWVHDQVRRFYEEAEWLISDQKETLMSENINTSEVGTNEVNQERAESLAAIFKYDLNNFGDLNEATVIRAMELAGIKKEKR